MIDSSGREAMAGDARDVGVLLLALVLGRAAHADPARPLAAAIRDARTRRAGRSRARRRGLGLEVFTREVEAAGVEVVHVDWRPPAGSPDVAALLARLDDD
jgi:hypothetical protein